MSTFTCIGSRGSTCALAVPAAVPSGAYAVKSTDDDTI
jgi:hypothetical protein